MRVENNLDAGSKYEVIYRSLKQDILDGKYLIGSLLPTELILQEKYDVSRSTVRRAMEKLKEDGMINVTRGHGAEVIKGKSSDQQKKFDPPYRSVFFDHRYLIEGKTEFSSMIIDTVQADPEIAAAMDVPVYTEVFRIQRLKIMNQDPFQYIISYVRKDFAPGLEQYSGRCFSLNKLLHHFYKLTPLGAEVDISAVSASFVEARLLNVKTGTPLLRELRIARCEEGIMEYSKSYIRNDVYHVKLTMEGAPDYMRYEQEPTDDEIWNS